MYKCADVDSLKDEFRTNKSLMSNLNLKDCSSSSSRTVKNNYGRANVQSMKHNLEKNYLDKCDTQKNSLDDNYIYFYNNLMEENSSKNSDRIIYRKNIDEQLNNYNYGNYNVDVNYEMYNKYDYSEKKKSYIMNSIRQLSKDKNNDLNLTKERIKDTYLNKSDGVNKNNDVIINMISNHYNNLIRDTNKGIENINSNCDAIIQKHNYDSISDISSTILVHKNETLPNNSEYSHYKYHNCSNDHTTSNEKDYGKGYEKGNTPSGNKGSNKIKGTHRECFPMEESSVINKNIDYLRDGRSDMIIRDSDVHSLSIHNDEELANKIYLDIDEKKEEKNTINKCLPNSDKGDTHSRSKIYNIFNNLNIKKSNNVNVGILNFLRNKRKNKYAYDNKGIKNDKAESSPVKDGDCPSSGCLGGGYIIGRSHSNEKQICIPSVNVRKVSANTPYDSAPMLKGCTYDNGEIKSKHISSHNLSEIHYIEESEGKVIKGELENKSNISSYETLKILEKEKGGNATNIYKSVVTEYLRKSENQSDAYSRAESVNVRQNNPFSLYHYVKKEQAKKARDVDMKNASLGQPSRASAHNNSNDNSAGIGSGLHGYSHDRWHGSIADYISTNSNHQDAVNKTVQMNSKTKLEKKSLRAFKTLSEIQSIQSSQYNNYSNTDLKNSLIGKQHWGNEKRNEANSNISNCNVSNFKKGVLADDKCHLGEKWNVQNINLQGKNEKSKKNEGDKSNEDLSSKYISSHYEASFASSEEYFSKSKKKKLENNKNAKSIRRRNVNNTDGKKLDIKKKGRTKRKKGCKKYHEKVTSDNSLDDCVKSSYQNDNPSRRHNNNIRSREINSNGNDAASAYKNDSHEMCIKTNRKKCQSRDSHPVHVKKMKKKNGSTGISQEKYYSKGGNRTGDNEREEYKKKNDFQNDDTCAGNVCSLSTSFKDLYRNRKNVMKISSGKYPCEDNPSKSNNYSKADDGKCFVENKNFAPNEAFISAHCFLHADGKNGNYNRNNGSKDYATESDCESSDALSRDMQDEENRTGRGKKLHKNDKRCTKKKKNMSLLKRRNTNTMCETDENEEPNNLTTLKNTKNENYIVTSGVNPSFMEKENAVNSKSSHNSSAKKKNSKKNIRQKKCNTKGYGKNETSSSGTSDSNIKCEGYESGESHESSESEVYTPPLDKLHLGKSVQVSRAHDNVIGVKNNSDGTPIGGRNNSHSSRNQSCKWKQSVKGQFRDSTHCHSSKEHYSDAHNGNETFLNNDSNMNMGNQANGVNQVGIINNHNSERRNKGGEKDFDPEDAVSYSHANAREEKKSLSNYISNKGKYAKAIILGNKQNARLMNKRMISGMRNISSDDNRSRSCEKAKGKHCDGHINEKNVIKSKLFMTNNELVVEKEQNTDEKRHEHGNFVKKGSITRINHREMHIAVSGKKTHKRDTRTNSNDVISAHTTNAQISISCANNESTITNGNIYVSKCSTVGGTSGGGTSGSADGSSDISVGKVGSLKKKGNDEKNTKSGEKFMYPYKGNFPNGTNMPKRETAKSANEHLKYITSEGNFKSCMRRNVKENECTNRSKRFESHSYRGDNNKDVTNESIATDEGTMYGKEIVREDRNNMLKHFPYHRNQPNTFILKERKGKGLISKCKGMEEVDKGKCMDNKIHLNYSNSSVNHQHENSKKEQISNNDIYTNLHKLEYRQNTQNDNNKNGIVSNDDFTHNDIHDESSIFFRDNLIAQRRKKQDEVISKIKLTNDEDLNKNFVKGIPQTFQNLVSETGNCKWNNGKSSFTNNHGISNEMCKSEGENILMNKKNKEENNKKNDIFGKVHIPCNSTLHNRIKFYKCDKPEKMYEINELTSTFSTLKEKKKDSVNYEKREDNKIVGNNNIHLNTLSNIFQRNMEKNPFCLYSDKKKNTNVEINLFPSLSNIKDRVEVGDKCAFNETQQNGEKCESKRIGMNSSTPFSKKSQRNVNKFMQSSFVNNTSTLENDAKERCMRVGNNNHNVYNEKNPFIDCCTGPGCSGICCTERCCTGRCCTERCCTERCCIERCCTGRCCTNTKSSLPRKGKGTHNNDATSNEPFSEEKTEHGVDLRSFYGESPFNKFNDNDSNNNADAKNHNNVSDKPTNMDITSTNNETDGKKVFENHTSMCHEMKGSVFLNEMLQKNNENASTFIKCSSFSNLSNVSSLGHLHSAGSASGMGCFGCFNSVSSFANMSDQNNRKNNENKVNCDNYFPSYLSNIPKIYKEKSDKYLNKKYIHDLDQINFLIQQFVDTYSCNENLKSIFQLLKYEIDKTKKESLHFCKDDKYLIFTIPLNDIKKAYDNYSFTQTKDPMCEYSIDRSIGGNSYNMPSDGCMYCEGNEEKVHLKNMHKIIKTRNVNWGASCNHVCGVENRERDSNAHNNSQCDDNTDRNRDGNRDSNRDGNRDGNREGNIEGNDCLSRKETGRKCRGILVRTPHNNLWNSSSNKGIKLSRFLLNHSKTYKQYKYCIKKKRINNGINEHFLSKMNIFLIKHNNHIYKFKLNSNFLLKNNQLNGKKNGKLFNLDFLYNNIFLKEYNEREVAFNSGTLWNSNTENTCTGNNVNEKNIRNSFINVTHTTVDNNVFSIIHNNTPINLDDLFISDDEVNLIYMYNNHRNEKVYSLEKLDFMKNDNSTSSSLNDASVANMLPVKE
ncbi:conserved Plasmodium protein, unknown function [Plasmodium ovale curtisi]|uniref:Uncharacterized protein n=1 Tax=Plasmodium ovale curtisi TaxID=864141 RepID=A0A1A8W565_PLAOA|nr:conserved Plasmodium protein, unknown function [Plasmodium ovale curtisi]